MANFVLIGAAGYVAPRHMDAIFTTGGNLLAALDPHDSVGILDTYFPQCKFFTEFERFDRYCELLLRRGTKIDFVVVCSPNYLHDAHCRFGLRIGADVICEKPLVTHERNLDGLLEVERYTGARVWTVLQLRIHPKLSQIKANLDKNIHEVSIEYTTPRGEWYLSTWKGDVTKSGGLATNIGVHLFDAAIYLFGNPISLKVDVNTPRLASGLIALERAGVSWCLSIENGAVPRRSFIVDGQQINFDNGFTDLHTEMYRRIMDGNGFCIEDSRQAIRICEQIR